MQKPIGLKMFLYEILALIKEGKKEATVSIEDALSKGVATYLCSKYPNEFSEVLSCDNIEKIDLYYKNSSGLPDGVEWRRYDCTSEDGLYLLLKLALNEIF